LTKKGGGDRTNEKRMVTGRNCHKGSKGEYNIIYHYRITKGAKKDIVTITPITRNPELFIEGIAPLKISSLK
jgi:hypothetical protein